MKTTKILSTLVLFSALLIFITGCKKDDPLHTPNPLTEVEPTDLPGIMMTLSAISYVADKYDATTIADSIDYFLGIPSLATKGNWKRVWGPAVSGTGSNMIYVAEVKTPTVPVYAIVIRGTNMNSIDGVLQDLRVFSLDWFKYGEPNDSVSRGAMEGFDSLMQSTYAGITLETYLTGLSNSQKIPLFVTGHSQGGSLAPLMAYWLVANTKFTDKFIFSTIAFAGPGVVNQNFKTNFFKALPSDGSFKMMVNTLDVIPYFWSDLPGIMAKNIPVTVPGLYKIAMEAAGTALQTAKITYFDLTDAYPIGNIPITDIGTINPSDTTKWYDHWVAVEHNHNNYLQLLGVPVIPN